MKENLIVMLSVGLLTSLGLHYYFSKHSRRRRRIPKELQTVECANELFACIELAYLAGEEVLKANNLSMDFDNKGAIDFVTSKHLYFLNMHEQLYN